MKWTFGRSEWTFGQKRVRSEWTFGQKRVRSEWTFGQKRERSDEDSSMMRSHAHFYHLYLVTSCNQGG